MVVLDDADLDLVVDGALFGAFGTAGQRCTSTSRLIVHRRRRRRSWSSASSSAPSALVLGDPLDARHRRRPGDHRRSAERIVGDDRAPRSPRAPRVVTGGDLVEVDGCEGGTFVAPRSSPACDPTTRIAREEVFGPVLVGHRGRRPRRGHRRRERRRVRPVGRGLHARHQRRAAGRRRIDTGIVYVNAPTIGAEIPLPFGGTKHTGNGFREAGTRGIEQFSQVKTVYVDYSGRLQQAQIDTHREDVR